MLAKDTAILFTCGPGTIQDRGARLPPRRTPAVAASLLVATALSVFGLSATAAQAQGRSGACEESNLAVLASPVAPWKGAPLRVVFTSEKALDGELSLVGPDGSVATNTPNIANAIVGSQVRDFMVPPGALDSCSCTCVRRPHSRSVSSA